MRRKAEETVKNQIDHTKDKSWDLNDVIYELRVHQIELEIQNEELREAQIKSEDSKREYFDLYNFAPLGYFTLNKEGIILQVNIAGATLLGVERINLNKTAFIQYIALDYRNQFHHHIKRVSETGTKQTVELKLINRDNDSFYTHLETVMIEDSYGNFKEFRIAIININDLKNTEMALKESEETYREIFVKNPSVMILIDPVNNNILDANPAAINYYGYSLEQLLKMKISDINASDASVVQDEMQETIPQQKDHFTIKHRLADGKIRDVDVHIGYIGYKGKNIICAIIIDITLQKKTEITLAQRNANINKMLNIEIDDHETAEMKLEKLIDNLEISNKELERFAYVSSHDLREPLRMITSFLQLLQKRYAPDLDEDANDFINFAVEGAKRLDMMINDILEYSKVGNTEKELKYLHTEKIIKQVLHSLKTLIEDNNAIVTYDPLPLIYANEHQMVQLFQNLIGNGIKYHGKNYPKIYISVEKKAEEYIFSVKDNGIGIDQQHLERIFTIFQRLHTREEYAGTGIGLAISQRIIQQHGGKIWAESELGKGTTFYFTIPIKQRVNS
jgi:chemotaxis family two-component system sensor kinase Cph1